MTNVLIIGMGSIGKKHFKVFQSFADDVRSVSAHGGGTYQTLEDALTDFAPKICVIANDTARHFETLKKLLTTEHPLRILVEKPLFDSTYSLNIPECKEVFVGYNLRFLPLLERLKEELASRQLVSADICCASYLPDWRPDSDYRKTSSAFLNRGGGVLTDLSHELDYVRWTLGNIEPVSILKGRFSSLEIETEDTAVILAKSATCAAISLRLNYTDRRPKRFFRVICNDATIEADLLENCLFVNDLCYKFEEAIQATYLAQAKALCASEVPANLCRYEDGLSVVKLIEHLKKLGNDKGQ